MLDVVQPGWREVVVTRKLLRDARRRRTTCRRPRAADCAGVRRGRSTGVANLWLAGDWIGPDGHAGRRRASRARALAARAAAEAGGVRVAA